MSDQHDSFLRSELGSYLRSPLGCKVRDIKRIIVDPGVPQSIVCLLDVERTGDYPGAVDLYILVMDALTFATRTFYRYPTRYSFTGDWYDAFGGTMLGGTPRRLAGVSAGRGNRAGIHAMFDYWENSGFPHPYIPNGYFPYRVREFTTIDPLTGATSSHSSIPMPGGNIDPAHNHAPYALAVGGVLGGNLFCVAYAVGGEIRQPPGRPDEYWTRERWQTEAILADPWFLPEPLHDGAAIYNPAHQWLRTYPNPDSYCEGFGPTYISGLFFGGSYFLRRYDSTTFERLPLVPLVGLPITGAVVANGGGGNDFMAVHTFNFRAEPSQYRFYTIDTRTAEVISAGHNPTIMGLEQNRLSFDMISYWAV